MKRTCLVICIGWCLLPAVAMAAEADAQPADWNTVRIPDAWKRAPGGIEYTSDGYCWFRCLVQIPARWKEGGDLELFAEAVDDAREIYFNGFKVGGHGSLPPRFRSGLGEDTRFVLPAKYVLFGDRNVVAIRVYENQARKNFNVAAPVVFGGGEAIRTDGDWRHRAGDDLAWAKLAGGAALGEPFARIDNADDVNRTLKKLEGDKGPLDPAAALAQMESPDDLVIEQPLADPVIGQPLSLKFDERGRMWVLQYLQYPNPAGLKMISRDKHLRSVYDKVPPPPPNHFPGRDTISIHEDTDGDGVYDKHKNFVDNLSLATSFTWGRGGVWVMNPPYLLFYPDANGDDVPDGDPQVHLQGFGLEDSHSIANNLRWGPDGWLYAAQGSTVTGNIIRPGIDKTPVHSMGQLIWRYHPETRRYEIFAEGGGNTFGVEVDSKGRVYSGTNGGDSRGYHYVQGGYFRKAFGKHGALSNPFAYGFFPHMEHHKIPRFTHTFVIYEGGALPPQYDGKLFGVGPLQSHVLFSDVARSGSSFKTKDLGFAITSSDQWFRPVDIQAGPDGALYVADFYEQRIDHASHYQGRVHKQSGRVYRIKGKDTPLPEKFDYRNLPTRDLVALLDHENKWRRQTALRLIADRRDPSIAPALRQMLRDRGGQAALEALWALNLSGGFNDEVAGETLNHDDPYVRLWTVRLLCDEKQVSDQMAEKLALAAYREPHVDARSQLACSARRLPAAQALPIVKNLLAHDEDAGDIHIPLLLWWAIESKAGSNRDAVLELFADSKLWDEPLVTGHILQRVMRRFAAAGSRQDLLACARLLELAPDKQHSELLLGGFEAAYQGRSLTGLPEELVAAMAKAGGGSLALRLRQGNAGAIADALAIVADEKAKPAERVLYIDIFGQIDRPRCTPALLDAAKTSKSDDVRKAAFSALQSYNDAEIASAVVALHNNLSADVRESAQTLLASRRTWASSLLNAVEAGAIDQETVSLPIVRRVLLHNDEQIAARVRKLWGDVQGATTEQMQTEIARLHEVINAGSGDPYSGKTLFMQSCGKCHVLFDEGGEIGPSLTSFKRDDLNQVLLNVVNPSIEIREGFENYVVFTEDGRTLNGFIADQDNRVVVLKGIDGQNTVIRREDIDEMAAIKRSIMPEAILKPFDDQQIRDLFAYLRATQPLP